MQQSEHHRIGSRENELRFIAGVAREAGEIITDFFQKQDFHAEEKKGEAFNFVTDADRAADQFIRNSIQERFPEDLILSEEHEPPVLDYDRRIWMVDPLDATKSFINGYDGFSVMIGLCEKGVPRMGVVYVPLRDVLFSGVVGGEASKEYGETTRAIRVSIISRLAEARLITRLSFGAERDSDNVMERLPVRTTIPESSVGIKLGLIAEGGAELHVNTQVRANKWDTCAPQAILESAGGRVTDLEDKPLDYTQPRVSWGKMWVASNGVVHEEALRQLQRLELL